MSEVVERNLETAVSELTYLKRAKIFDDNQLKEIVRKRRRHEYSLQKRTKRVLDYNSYISTELALIRLIRIRRNCLQEFRFVDKIEKSITARLVRLHRQLCYRFQSRVDVWLRCIKLHLLLRRHMSAGRVWSRLLQVHGRTDPRLWAAAASFHLHEGCKIKARSELRLKEKERDKLNAERERLLQEYRIIREAGDSKENPTTKHLFAELKYTASKLKDLEVGMARQRRLVWDRSVLTALRDARQLITQGIQFNPESWFLHIELAKLELCAADFFNLHVRKRQVRLTKARSEVHVSQSQSENADSLWSGQTVKANRKRLNNDRLCKRDQEDDEEFMKTITEDVDLVASGSAAQIVFRDSLERWGGDLSVLQALSNLTTSKTRKFLGEELIDCVKRKLEATNETVGSIASLSTPADPSPSEEVRLTLGNRILELHLAVQSDGVTAAYDLWSKWYEQADSGMEAHSSRQNTLLPELRCLNPSWSQAMGLLRARLLLDQVALNKYYKVTGTQHAHPVVRMEHTRRMMDALATSRWGRESSEFWTMYMELERRVGDCTRLPSLQWRAEKCLNADALSQFHSAMAERLD